MIFLALEMYDGMLPFYGLVCGPKTIVVNVLGVQYISYQSSSTILVAVDRLRKHPSSKYIITLEPYVNIVSLYKEIYSLAMILHS